MEVREQLRLEREVAATERPSDAGQQPTGRLDGAAAFTQEVAALEDGAGVVGERGLVGGDPLCPFEHGPSL